MFGENKTESPGSSHRRRTLGIVYCPSGIGSDNLLTSHRFLHEFGLMLVLQRGFCNGANT